MRVTFGIKAHSGWAALVAAGLQSGELVVVDRLRLALADDDQGRFLYHAAKDLDSNVAREFVTHGIAAANRNATRELDAARRHTQASGHEVVACAVLVGEPMPDWNLAEILAVHFRMHKAEGALFRDALVAATQASGLGLVAIPEKTLLRRTEQALTMSSAALDARLAALGKRLGPPWGRDQKDCALAAWTALAQPITRS